MASTSKPRTNSPFRFRKPASLNGKLPAPALSSSSSQSTVGSAMKPLSGRSVTPGRRSLSPAPPVITPQKYRNVSSTSSASMGGSPRTPTSERADFLGRAKENISVTLRFRPLSAREIQKGDEVAWYADGDTSVRSEFNPSTAYAFDRVFGPATTTRGVYDVAAQLVVQGAMEGVNGTVFAYGVTSSGKTHTMHGDQKSPGIIPLAVKDVFSIIQETPSREFLLRVSYLEIYNEVINDLLDPAGQNLRVREDAQGTYVEGIKEEVVLSPAHALSLIAAGEEHRHVGSNNFNLLSSRSHTIFTLTVESSPRGEGYGEEDVTLSQLNLIDLAGSESSKTETTGLRRKEGSYINKSLLTLGTVIAKLSDGKASHIPYRDSKLTRLLQSSLSGHGRISLICTITPASSNNEETHNTLKFAHRAKRVEIHLASNKILDEKSLIKKYQREISSLKQELEQLKRGILEGPYIPSSHEDLVTLRQQLEQGQMKMQSRLEEEEQAKAALMGRIQRLTKLILVSTKNSIPPKVADKPMHRRRHSFGEEELAYLPDKRRELAYDDEEESNHGGLDSEQSGDGNANSVEEGSREEKKTKRRGMLGWFKLRRNENMHISPANSLDHESPQGSTGSHVSSTLQFEQTFDSKGGRRKSFSRRVDELTPVDSFPEPTQAGELFSATVRGRRPPPTGTTMVDQMDLLREQIKMIAGEVALCTSSLKRMQEQAAKNTDDVHLQVQMQKTKEEIQEKKRQMRLLEQRIVGTADNAANTTAPFELSQTIVKLTSQLNEKAFDLEIKSADNRILQEQLQSKTTEISELQATVTSLRRQLQAALEKPLQHKRLRSFIENNEDVGGWLNTGCLSGELRFVEGGAEVDTQNSFNSRGSSKDLDADSNLQSQLLLQVEEVEKLKHENSLLLEDKEGLEIRCEKLADEAAYAKELASAAAVELKNLAEEVTKLSFQNTKLANDLATAQELAFSRISAKALPSNGHLKPTANSETQTDKDIVEANGAHQDSFLVDLNGRQSFDDLDVWRLESDNALEMLRSELKTLKEQEGNLKAKLDEREDIEADLLSRIEDSKQREIDLENDLAGMWVLVAKLKKEREALELQLRTDDEERQRTADITLGNGNKVKGEEDASALEELRACLEDERRRGAELDALVSQLKSEDLDGLGMATLEDLSNLHVEALTKLCQAKAREQERSEKDRGRESQAKIQYNMSALELDALHVEEERNGHVCKVCFEAPTAAVLLPCRHFCLCKTCAIACTECPLCRSAIADRIITFAS